MLILTVRTDKPEAELGLYEDENLLEGFNWLAHRELAETIHMQIAKILKLKSKTFSDIQGIVIYKGPGSFTGLRIGVATANALADGLGIPIVGTATKNWRLTGIQNLLDGKNDTQIVPDYGSDAHTTSPNR